MAEFSGHKELTTHQPKTHTHTREGPGTELWSFLCTYLSSLLTGCRRRDTRTAFPPSSSRNKRMWSMNAENAGRADFPPQTQRHNNRRCTFSSEMPGLLFVLFLSVSLYSVCILPAKGSRERRTKERWRNCAKLFANFRTHTHSSSNK